MLNFEFCLEKDLLGVVSQTYARGQKQKRFFLTNLLLECAIQLRSKHSHRYACCTVTCTRHVIKGCSPTPGLTGCRASWYYVQHPFTRSPGGITASIHP